MAANLIPAAQYLRMSSEHQQYSLDNQVPVIQRYAEENGFAVLYTYADPARSGLALANRDGLRQLLNEVVSGIARFKAILVYDVSRWGRFQDVDEAAHYEFLCRSAGIQVHYCAEPFSNHGTVVDALMKAIKRMAAADYSRELGAKVAAGQRNMFKRGFRGGGGPAGFGLRRMLVAPDGTSKQMLAEGERKALQSDRVILVPGPPDEVAWVQEIFRLFTEEQRSYRNIATILNAHHVPYRKQRPWDLYAIQRIVGNPKYNGRLSYGMSTQRLRTKFRKLPESEWLVVPHETCKIVDDETFTAARNRIQSFTCNKSDEQLLDELRAILAVKGRLSAHIIYRHPGATSPYSYRCRFGSLLNAFQKIGYSGYAERARGTHTRVHDMHLQFTQKLLDMFPSELTLHGQCGKGKSSRKWLEMWDGTKISIRFCIQPVFVQAKPLWRMNRVDRESDWITLVVLLNRQNTLIERLLLYHSVPKANLSLPADAPWLKQGVELRDLNDFCRAVRKIQRAKRAKCEN